MMQSTIPRYSAQTSGPIPNLTNVSAGNTPAMLRTHTTPDSLRIQQYHDALQQELSRTAHLMSHPPQLSNWGVQPSDLSRSNIRQGVPNAALPTSEGVVRIPYFPEVTFTDTPFYEILDVIQSPTLIVPPDVNFHTGKRPYERIYEFRLNAHQSETITYHSFNANNRREFRVQALVRFGKLEPATLQQMAASRSTLEPFQDNMPIHLAVQVNQRNVILPPFLPTSRPNMDGRRNARPISITPQLRMCPSEVNMLKLSWSHDYTSYTYYFFAIYLVKKLSTKELCERLKTNSFQPAQVIRKQIIEKLASTGSQNAEEDEDDDIQIQNTLPVQLLCPLSKCRISLPVRGKRCQHIQCYDADTYLIINERKPAWKCPVCDLLAPFDELFVDGLLMEVLESKETLGVEEIVFNEDGSWTTMKSSGCGGGANGSMENSRCSSPLSTSNGEPGSKTASTNNLNTSGCSGGGGGDVTIDLTASDDEDNISGPQPPKRPTVGHHQSSSAAAPSRQPSSSSTSSGYRVPHPPPGPSQHDSLSNQFLQQHHRHRLVPPGINAVRYAHSNSVPSNHHHSQSIVSNPALLVDAKPDPRRAFLSSHAHSIPASRPCSHSATPSPRTPQSLGHSSSVAAGVGAGKSSLSIPQMVSSLTHPNNIPVPLNFNAKELMAKMAASFSPQILETCMRIPEYNHFSTNSFPQQPHPPPKLAHQNSNGNGTTNSISSNNVSQSRGSNILPPPFAAQISNLAHQQWRTNPATAPSIPNGSSNSSSAVIGNNSSSSVVNPSSFLFPNGGSGGGIGGRVPPTCSSSPSLLDLWSVAAAAQMTSAHPLISHSLGDLYRSALPPSPPRAHSSNLTPPPPPKGDPRHPESGGLFTNPSGWSANHP